MIAISRTKSNNFGFGGAMAGPRHRSHASRGRPHLDQRGSAEGSAAAGLFLCRRLLAGHATRRFETRLAGAQPWPAGGLSDHLCLPGDGPRRDAANRRSIRWLPIPAMWPLWQRSTDCPSTVPMLPRWMSSPQTNFSFSASGSELGFLAPRN